VFVVGYYFVGGCWFLCIGGVGFRLFGLFLVFFDGVEDFL